MNKKCGKYVVKYNQALTWQNADVYNTFDVNIDDKVKHSTWEGTKMY